MAFTFKDFIARLLSNFVDSMTRSCCAPSTGKYDLALQDPEESKLSDIAKEMTAFNDDFGEPSDRNCYIDTNQFQMKQFPDLKHCDISLISGFLRELTNDMTPTASPNGYGISSNPITFLCLTYFHTISCSDKDRFIYLISERCELSSYPSLDYSDDEEDGEPCTRHQVLDIDATSPNTGGIYISDIKNTSKKYHTTIYDLDGANQFSILSQDWIIKFAALTSKRNLLLPNSIHSNIMNQYKTRENISNDYLKMRQFNVLFRLCGSGNMGWTDACNAVIVDETALHYKTKSDLVGFNWRLPELPIKTGGNGVTFNNTYGLLSLGGYNCNKFYSLSFNSPAYFQQNYDWHWNELASMNESRWFPSCCTFNDKLIAMCGSSQDHEPLNTMECYDFANDKWLHLSPCNVARKYGGLAYMEGTHRLYLGGGDYATQSVEYYDTHKNQWYALPNTQIPHKYYPNLWQHEENANIIYISCSYSNSIECLDLRDNQTSWNVICAAKLFQTDSLDLDYNQFRSIL